MDQINRKNRLAAVIKEWLRLIRCGTGMKMPLARMSTSEFGVSRTVICETEAVLFSVREPGKWLGIAETGRHCGSGRSAPLTGNVPISGERNSHARETVGTLIAGRILSPLRGACFLRLTVLLMTMFCVRLAAAPLLYLDFHTGDGANPAPDGLKKLFSAIENISVQALEGKNLSAADGRVLLVSESEHFPASAITGLEQYLISGGNVIFTGADRPFTAPPVRDGDRFLTPAAVEGKLARLEGRDIGIIAPGLEYTRHCSREDAASAGSAEIAEDGGVLRILFPDHRQWDSWSTPPDVVRIPADTRLIRLQVRGDCPALSMELREKNGTRWIAPFTVGTEWKTVLLPSDAFKIWGPRRGPHNQVTFTDVNGVFFGISASHTPTVPTGTSYRVEIRHVEAIDCGEIPAISYPAFSLEGVAPDYKTYVLPGPVKINTVSGAAFEFPDGFISPVPRMMGCGIGMNRPWRFIPLATAQNDRNGTGYPVWIMLQLDRAYKGSTVAGMGFALKTILEKPELVAELTALVKRLDAGNFLAAAGPSEFIVDPGEEIAYGAEVFHASSGSRVQAALKAPDGRIVACFERAFDGEQREIVETMKAPEPGTYLCTVELLDPESRVVDSIESELSVSGGRPDPASAFVSVDKDNFVIDGIPFYPNGVNFFPIYGMAGLDGKDYWTGWCNRSFYDPGLVDAELRAVKALGFNVISVHPSDRNVPDLRAIRDLLYRCRKYGLRLNLYTGGLATHPLGFDADEFRKIVTETRLKDDAFLFCYDIVWEASNFLYRTEYRKRFLPEWNRWIVRQYGSPDEAVQDWRFDPGRSEKDEINDPTDDQLSRDGDHRVFVAAYRRFMDDHCHRLWQHAVDRMRTIDPNHLITNRAGNITPHDNAFTGPVKALDFISPEGYTVGNNETGEGAVGFATRYIDYASGGKPIIWSEFGIRVLGVGSNLPDPQRLEAYARYDSIFYRRGLEAGAQGFAPWWWAGGFRVNENSDCGVVNVDGSAREVGRMIAGYVPKVTEPRTRRHGKVFFDFDRDAHAGGYWEATFNEGGKAYLAAVTAGDMLEIRTPATGKTSVDVPIVGIGNVPYTGRNPVKYLNGAVEKLEYRNPDGEWLAIADGDTIKMTGDLRLRAKFGNTGEVPFIAGSGKGCVSLRAAWTGRFADFALESDLPRLKDTRLEFELPAEAEGEISIRFDARERAAFGESFHFFRER